MNRLDKPNLTELSAFYASQKKMERVFVKERRFYSLTYRYSGTISVETEKETLISEGGSVTFIPKGLAYQTEILEDVRMAAIHFCLDRDIAFRNAAVLPIQSPELVLLFEKLIRSLHVNTPVDFHALSVFYELLARLEGDALAATAAFSPIPTTIRAAKEYAEQHYADPTLSVEELADRFQISSSYLRREFSKCYTISPLRFLRGIRVEKAKAMLESGYLSISEISRQCGFSSTSYFIQVFHALMGESPDRYRRNLKA